MTALVDAASQLGLPVAVHTGAADAHACDPRRRTQPRARLPDRRRRYRDAEAAGTFIVPTMQMTREDLDQLKQGTLPPQAVHKFRPDAEQVQAAQRRVAASSVKIAFGTDCGTFPFAHGVEEFQAMVAAGVHPVRALRAASSVAAGMPDPGAIGVLAAGRCADLVGMPVTPRAIWPQPPGSISDGWWSNPPPPRTRRELGDLRARGPTS